MADNITTRITLEGGADIRAAFASIAQAAQGLADKLNALGGNAAGLDKVRQQTDGLRTSMAGAAKEADTLGGRLSRAFGAVTETATRAGLAVGGLVAAAKLATGKLASDAADSANDIGEKAEKVGLGVKAYQQLAFAAEKLKVSNEALTNGFGALSDSIDTVQQGANKFGTFAGQSTAKNGIGVTSFSSAADKDPKVEALKQQTRELQQVFRDLGVPLTEFRAALESTSDAEADDSKETAASTLQLRDKAAVIQDVIDRLRKMPESAKKATLETTLFGSSVSELQPLLKLTSAELEKYRKDFDATGRALTENDAQNAASFIAARKDLDSAFKATRDQLGLLFVPGKTAANQFFAGIVDALRPVIVGFAAAGVEATKLFAGDPANRQRFIDGIKFVLTTLADMGSIIKALVVPAFQALDRGLDAIAATFTALLGQDVSKEFVTAAGAVFGLARAFGVLSFSTEAVVGALTLITGLFTGLGPLAILAASAVTLYFDDIATAGGEAFDAIAEHADQFRDAFRKLVTGDFKGAFSSFKAAAVETFQDIEARVPLVARVVAGIGATFKELRESIVGTFGFARIILSAFALELNVIFGTSFTDKSLAATVALLYYTKALVPLASVSVIVASAIRSLGGALTLVLVGFAALSRLGFLQVLKDIAAGFKAIFNGDLPGAIDKLGKDFQKFLSNLEDASLHTWGVIAAGAIAAFILIRQGATATAFSVAGIFVRLPGIVALLDLLRKGFVQIAVTALLAFDAVKKLFSGDFAGFGRGIKAAFGFAFDGLASADKGTWAEIALAATLCFGGIAKTASRIFRLTGTIISGALSLAFAGLEAVIAPSLTALAAEGGAVLTAAGGAGTAIGGAMIGGILAVFTLASAGLIAFLDGIGKKAADDIRGAIKDQEAEQKQQAEKQAADGEAQLFRDKADLAATNPNGPRQNDTDKSVFTDLSDRAPKGFSGLQSAIQDADRAITDLSDRAPQGFARIGQAVSAVTEKVKEVTDKAAEGFPRVLRGGKEIRDAFSGKDADQGFISKAIDQIKEMVLGTDDVTKAADKAKDAIKGVGEELPKVFDQTELKKAREEFANVAKAAGEIKDNLGGVKAQFLDPNQLNDIAAGAPDSAGASPGGTFNADKFRPSSNVEDRRPGFTTSDFQKSADDALSAFNQISGSAKESAANVSIFFDQAFKSLFNGVVVVADGFTGLSKSIAEDVEKIVAPALDAAQKQLQNIKDAASLPPRSLFAETAPQTDATAAQPAIDTQQSSTQTAVQQIGDAVRSLSPVFDDVWNGFAEAAQAAFSVVTAGVDQLISSLLDKLQQIQNRAAAITQAATGASDADSLKTKLIDVGSNVPGADLGDNTPVPGGAFNADKLRPSTNIEDRRPEFANDFQKQANDAADAFEQIRSLAQSTFQSIVDYSKQASEVLQADISSVGEIFTSVFQGIFHNVELNVTPAFDAILDKIKAVKDALTSAQKAPVALATQAEQQPAPDAPPKSLFAQFDEQKAAANKPAAELPAVGTLFNGLLSSAQEAIPAVVQIVQDGVAQIIAALGTIATSFGAAFEGVAASAGQAIQTLLDKLQQVQDRASAITPAAGGASDAQPSPFATGGIPLTGILRGPGTDTSDSIVIRASRDEGIVQAKAVRHYGRDVFHAFNQMLIPRDRLLGFATGGIPMPSFGLAGLADGLASNLAATVALPAFTPSLALGGVVAAGSSQALHPVTFNLPGGGTVSARMSPAEFENAQRSFLVRKSMSQA